MIFLEKQHQAMLFLKGILFDTVPMVFIGNLPLKKNFFFA
jgi:hypothetical protein